MYSEAVFFEHFRVSREISNNIAGLYRQSNLYKDNQGQFGNICALHQVRSSYLNNIYKLTFLSTQVSIFLWYIGHQTASFERLAVYISNLSATIIKWPSEAEKRITEEHFRINGFPNIIG